jgi:hypothetical protein
MWKRNTIAGWLSLAALTLTACTRVAPYHTIAPDDPRAIPGTNCKRTSTGTVPEACRSLVVEHAPEYDLYFAEFDDQGWPFDAPRYGAAGRQTPIFIDNLRHELSDGADGLSIVTFVHGWKHSAASEDDDVDTFRQVLTGLSHLESQNARCRRKVIGLYVGWRGRALSLGDTIENVSFWDRKNVAAKVAQGSVRELFARIRSLEGAANQPHPGPTDQPCRDHRVRSMYIGHSFGGLILFTVLSEALIKDVADFQDAMRESGNGRRPAMLQREGDLVLLVNPAIEATRYDALSRAVQRQPSEVYEAPLFVSIASVDDDATRVAFPIGRALGTIFEAYSPALRSTERAANLKTISQDAHYLTMSLRVLSDYNRAHPEHQIAPSPACVGYVQAKGVPPAEELKLHVGKERENFELFRKSLGRDGTAAHSFPRQFCGDPEGMVLSLLSERAPDGTWRSIDPNSPVWNIQTAAPIIGSHGDISNHLMLQFVRQLYLDSEQSTFSERPGGEKTSPGRPSR